MKKKNIFLVTLALFLTLGLAACAGDGNGYEEAVAEPAEIVEEDEPEETVDAPAHATSAAGITDGERLQAVLGADSDERAWVAGMAADIEMDGPLVIEGNVEAHLAGTWSGAYSRKLGFYRRSEINGLVHVPVGAVNLTVANGIYVRSPQTFFISDGPFMANVFGDVFVEIENFRLTGVTINGNLHFQTQEQFESATAQIWDADLAVIREGDDADYESEFALYQSNSGFGTISTSDATQNVSNASLFDLVTGTIYVAGEAVTQ